MKLIQNFGHEFGSMALPFPHQIALVALMGGLASGCGTTDFINIQIVHWGVTFSFATHQNSTFTLKGGIVTFDPVDR